jgi:DNA polymerase-3 subunit delta'
MSLAPAPWHVWGNADAVAGLRDAVRTGRLSHAYILSGPVGVGKSTLARAMARALLCGAGPSAGEPCDGSCLACRKIDRGVHPDVQTWDIDRQIAATSGKQTGKNTTMTIETMRSMIAASALRPIEGRWRIAIVDDAELLQEAAQEALLKTLEEPPSFTIIVLATDEIDALLPTIRSRAQHVELRPVAAATIESGLIANGAPAEKARDLAVLANGAPGWAISALRDERLAAERVATIDRAIAWATANPHARVVTAIRSGDRFAKDRAPVLEELSALTGVWRDAMLIRAGQERHVHYRLRLDQLRSLAERLSLRETHEAVTSVRACIRDLEANVRPRLAIEHMVLQWPTH